VSRILIVDDHEDIRLLLRIELSGDGHQISEAGDGVQALAALEADPPDLMLLDIMMPILDGWEVLRRLVDPAERDEYRRRRLARAQRGS